MKHLSLIVLLLLVPAALLAQDWRGPGSGGGHLRIAPNAHSGSSPFDPRKEDDTRFFVDSGSGLDTGCTFRSGGPLTIHLKVKRFVGDDSPVNLANKGYLSKKAHVRLPAFDVDINGAPGFPPEIDRISFNGHPLGNLSGDNNIWKLNEFDVDIDWVNFATKGSGGSAGTPGDNVVQIDIDTASGADENWCTSIDWVEIEFDAVAPIFMVHGTNAQKDTWDPNFTAFFNGTKLPATNDINLQKNGSILGNGALLASRVQALAKQYGAKKCHIIAHSKGGLDTRAYLNNQYDPDTLKVLSVFTLSTPHHGTIVSDIIVAKRASTNPESANPDVSYLVDHDYWFLSTPQEPAIGNQTTTAMALFNVTYPSVPGGVKFYNYGADADLNGNGTIQANETAELIDSSLVSDATKAAAGTAMYRAIGNVASIRLVYGTRPGRLWGTNSFTDIQVASTNNPFKLNDLVTAVDSSKSPGGIFLGQRAANHSSMKTTALANTILQRILSDYPVK
jgi:triacylglycerol esterase/lipase EstA (alpha/beta hydrolase family)